MLKNMPKIISPELLKVLCEMGHGDEIVIGDANFPAAEMSKNSKLIRADGIGACDLLFALLTLIPLDQYDKRNFMLMEVVKGDNYDPIIWNEYKKILSKFEPTATVSTLERFDFYERAKTAYAIIASGEEAIYANIILKKGVIS